MKIQVRDKTTGVIYSNDMSSDNTILEMHFCTSYTQVEVQDILEKDGKKTYPKHTIIIATANGLGDVNWIDFIAVKDNNLGEFV